MTQQQYSDDFVENGEGFFLTTTFMRALWVSTYASCVLSMRVVKLVLAQHSRMFVGRFMQERAVSMAKYSSWVFQ